MVDYSKLKAGDKVRLVSVRPRRWNSKGQMDEYLGSIQTIRSVYGDTENSALYFENHPPKWSFENKDIAEVLTPTTINNSYNIY